MNPTSEALWEDLSKNKVASPRPNLYRTTLNFPAISSIMKNNIVRSLWGRNVHESHAGIKHYTETLHLRRRK